MFVGLDHSNVSNISSGLMARIITIIMHHFSLALLTVKILQVVTNVVLYFIE